MNIPDDETLASLYEARDRSVTWAKHITDELFGTLEPGELAETDQVFASTTLPLIWHALLFASWEGFHGTDSDEAKDVHAGVVATLYTHAALFGVKVP